MFWRKETLIILKGLGCFSTRNAKSEGAALGKDLGITQVTEYCYNDKAKQPRWDSAQEKARLEWWCLIRKHT